MPTAKPIIQIDNAGESLIIGNEAKRNRCYPDNLGKSTIGLGHLIKPNEYYLKTQVLKDSEVLDIFYDDLKPRENWLVRNTGKWSVPINQNEFNGLTSFIWQYDLDNPEYAGTKNAVISGNREDIIAHMRLFKNSVAGNGDNKMVPRRDKEIAMFLKAV